MLQTVNDSKTPRRRATYEDIVRLPEHVVGELIDGELVVSPRPAMPHASVSFALGVMLGSRFQFDTAGPGGWRFFNEPELHVAEDVLVPDLAGWREERVPRPLNLPYMTIAPDWVCEVLSPSTTKWDRGRKREIYAREGVRHAWFVDPLQQTLEVLALDGAELVPVATHRDQARVRTVPFESLEISLPTLWGSR